MHILRARTRRFVWHIQAPVVCHGITPLSYKKSPLCRVWLNLSNNLSAWLASICAYPIWARFSRHMSDCSYTGQIVRTCVKNSRDSVTLMYRIKIYNPAWRFSELSACRWWLRNGDTNGAALINCNRIWMAIGTRFHTLSFLKDAQMCRHFAAETFRMPMSSTQCMSSCIPMSIRICEAVPNRNTQSKLSRIFTQSINKQ